MRLKNNLFAFTPLEKARQIKNKFSNGTIKNSLTGFTLIELVVAITVFSIVAVAVYSTFNTGMGAYRKTESFAKLYQESRSISQMIARDLRNSFAYSQGEARFIGSNNEVSFFTLVDFSSEDNSRSEIAQITYRFENGVLKRLSLVGPYVFAEDEQAKIPQEDFSLEIKDLKFQYAYSTEETPGYFWQDDWDEEKEETKGEVPLGVKIELRLEDKETGKTVMQERSVFISAGKLGVSSVE